MAEFLVNEQLNLAAVRAQLNEEEFHQGVRRLPIGRASELFAGRLPNEVDAGVQRLADELATHDLALERTPAETDQLVVVQRLARRPPDLNAMARAMQWVAQITTVALEMVLPAVVGNWLDGRFNTSFLTVAGLLIGVPLGLWHLLVLTRR